MNYYRDWHWMPVSYPGWERFPMMSDEAENAYQTWCREKELDPEDTTSMVMYEEEVSGGFEEPETEQDSISSESERSNQ